MTSFECKSNLLARKLGYKTASFQEAKSKRLWMKEVRAKEAPEMTIDILFLMI